MSTLRFRSMGCEIVAAGASGEIRALFDRYDATFSRFRAGSELNRLNARGGGRVSTLFAEALETALWAAERTGGLVDPTVGAAVLAAGYDRDFSLGLDSATPAGSARVPGWWRVRLTGRVLRLPTGCVLDLNGVVKALALDAAAATLAADGFVSAGGDLATRGPVDVALPAEGAVRVEGGLATSGTTVRRWLRAGIEQHHLVDPVGGLPARTPWAAVSVAGATCLDADVAAKAALLLGAEGPDWLETRGLPGRFVAADGSVVTTGGWPVERELGHPSATEGAFRRRLAARGGVLGRPDRTPLSGLPASLPRTPSHAPVPHRTCGRVS